MRIILVFSALAVLLVGALSPELSFGQTSQERVYVVQIGDEPHVLFYDIRKVAQEPKINLPLTDSGKPLSLRFKAHGEVDLFIGSARTDRGVIKGFPGCPNGPFYVQWDWMQEWQEAQALALARSASCSK